MAFLIKRGTRQSASSASVGGQAVVEQLVQVSRPSLALPQSTTEQLFRVRGGRVKVKALLGQVATTAIQSTDPVMKVSSKALDTASAAVGTAVDVASTVDTSSLEIGGTVFVEGDGTALVKANAGATFIGTNSGEWIAPQGEIYLTTGASKTGQMKWDIWYEPLDAGSYVEAVGVATAAI
jgi:hypothetical protein